MNPYAYTEEEIPPYVEKTDLGGLMVSGAVAVLCLCIAFALVVNALILLQQCNS